MAQAESIERWWICTGPLWQGGTKIIGPFESSDLALRVRTYVEAVPQAERPDQDARDYATFWVDQGGSRRDAVAGPGHAEDVPVSASEPTHDPKAGVRQ